MKKRFLLFSFSLLILVILAGCSTTSSTNSSNDEITTGQNGGDQIETTSGPNQLPTFLKNVDPSISNVYKLAADNQQLLASIACYCGCGDSVGHKSNLNCFIKEKKADGSIVWDTHAITCNNCQQIATESVNMKTELGKSFLEIRKAIDNKYKEGFAKPTPTPLPVQ